jgi:hypothetical protein
VEASIDAVRVAVGVAGLAAAAASDLKTREVSDRLWYALAAVAILLFAFDFSQRFGGDSWILSVPVALVFVVTVTGGEIIPVFPGPEVPDEEVELSPAQKRILRMDGLLSVAMLGSAALVFALAPTLNLGMRATVLDGPEAIAYSTCLMIAGGFVFYVMGALHGGADAKAFMVLAVLFPVFPALPGLPLVAPSGTARLVVPFALAVLFNGALLLVAAVPVVYMVKGALAGRLKLPESLFGYQKRVADVVLEREFLMGAVVDGAWRSKVMALRATRSDAEQRAALEFLKSQLTAAVFVTPKFPFMVFLLAGLVLALLLTSPLHWL